MLCLAPTVVYCPGQPTLPWETGREVRRRRRKYIDSLGILQTSLLLEHLPSLKFTGPVKLNCVVTCVLENLPGWGWCSVAELLLEVLGLDSSTAH